MNGENLSQRATEVLTQLDDVLAEIERLRSKADELIAAAAMISPDNSPARDTLSDMAEGYDRLAKRLEDLVAKKQLAGTSKR